MQGINIATTQDIQKDTENINSEKEQKHVDDRTKQRTHIFVPKDPLPIHLTGTILRYVQIPLQQKIEHQHCQSVYQNRTHVPYQNGKDDIQRNRQTLPQNSRWEISKWRRNQNDNRYPHTEKN